ncbi:peptidyl-prolyl cis-trans FKBP-type protein, putative [Babesia ovata]|uniref:Peptidyl-prolyl cis-trans FKBP-type protein, putative n=1 Tax=Babesia ovata TaxID=189622 RepID=A0A2H6KJU6_9APIC|nr:peptidyl-prolyl cis-trans FKBP-type protein, putative [Babesia ovata]GBE63273.1 peptidyl-prolyl cis-trans FKBP-type protein, putative [Babesia ovata]
MKHHVQAFLAVLRVIQSHGVAMEVAGVGCQSTAVAEHSGEDAGRVRGERVNGVHQSVGRESGGIEAILSLLAVTQFNASTQLIIDTVVLKARQPYEHLVD